MIEREQSNTSFGFSTPNTSRRRRGGKAIAEIVRRVANEVLWSQGDVWGARGEVAVVSAATEDCRMRCASQRVTKTALDKLVAATALIMLSPLLTFLAVAIRLTMGRPVVFRQERPGREGTPFSMYKFRTMLDLRDGEGYLLPDACRLTRIGRFLRNTSLDELPELWNVLRGEMSLVGPRPLLLAYLDRYTPQQARRHEVKPGITGWAQVNGRNAISWEEKFELDVWYVDHQSFWLDLKILWITVFKVLKRSGVSATEHATMPEFQGSTEEQQRAA